MNNNGQGGKKTSVLLVDDSRCCLDPLKDLLEFRGYQVTAEANAMRAVAHFKEHPERYDLVMSDYQMPEISGVEVLDFVRFLRPETPTILMSGDPFAEDYPDVQRSHIDLILVKPFEIEDLEAGLLQADRSGCRRNRR
jgi:CheY-like chemotaxis protein